MLKKVKITLLVSVDTENEGHKIFCPSGDPLEENCVLNMVDNGDFLQPVSVLEVSYHHD